MRPQSPRLSRDHVAAAIALLLVLAAAGSYVGAMRGRSSRREAALLVSQINLALDDVAVSTDATATDTELRKIVYVTEEKVLFFFDSDLSAAIPDVTAPERQAWAATCLAVDLGARYQSGVTQPKITDVIRAEAVLQEYPEWRGMVIGTGAEARIDNTDGKAVAFLLGEMHGLQATATTLCGPYLALDGDR